MFEKFFCDCLLEKYRDIKTRKPLHFLPFTRKLRMIVDVFGRSSGSGFLPSHPDKQNSGL